MFAREAIPKYLAYLDTWDRLPSKHLQAAQLLLQFQTPCSALGIEAGLKGYLYTLDCLSFLDHLLTAHLIRSATHNEQSLHVELVPWCLG